MYQSLVKPVFDKLISLMLLIVLSPIFLLITLILLITTGGRPFFIHPRPGREEKIIRMLKFRTMIDILTEGTVEKQVTQFGKFLRKTSLDEIPQLLNVLKGDMSLVGPRPLHTWYLPLYNKEQYRRHEVKPGITGWAQVHGRNTVTWQQRFKYDVWYVDNISFALDLKILFMTVSKVFTGEGISQSGYLTCEKFTGNPEEPVSIDEKPFKRILMGEKRERHLA